MMLHHKTSLCQLCSFFHFFICWIVCTGHPTFNHKQQTLETIHQIFWVCHNAPESIRIVSRLEQVAIFMPFIPVTAYPLETLWQLLLPPKKLVINNSIIHDASANASANAFSLFCSASYAFTSVFASAFGCTLKTCPMISLADEPNAHCCWMVGTAFLFASVVFMV